MGVIVDTSVLVSGERRRLNLAAFRTALRNEQLMISAVTLSELQHAVHRTKNPEQLRRRLEFMKEELAMYPVVVFGQDEASRHAEITAKLEMTGNTIGAYDSLIAATALARGWSLATLNLSEFNRVEGLIVLDAKPWLIA